MKTVQEWMDLTRSVTRNYTPDQLIDIALSCDMIERAGGCPAVWHEAAMVRKGQCNCQRCLGHANPHLISDRRENRRFQ